MFDVHRNKIVIRTRKQTHVNNIDMDSPHQKDKYIP